MRSGVSSETVAGGVFADAEEQFAVELLGGERCGEWVQWCPRACHVWLIVDSACRLMRVAGVFERVVAGLFDS